MTASKVPSLRPTVRALLAGAVGAAIIGGIVPYCNMILQGSRISSYFNTPIAVILFFLLVLLLNPLLGFLRSSWMLSRAELALVYIMWIVAAAIPEWGFTAFLLTQVTGLVYYASPENRWDELLLPHVADWLIPTADMNLIKGFYEGAPQGEGIPWGIWLRPLILWGCFIMALYLAMISIMVILRKQWIERECLVFPMVQLPISMIQDSNARPSLLKPFFKNPLMWFGFAIPLIVGSTKGLNHYIPYFPAIELYGGSMPLFGVHLSIILSLQMLGFSYLVNREISLSLCLFFLLSTMEIGLFNMLGIQETDPLLGPYSSRKGSIIVHQGFGAVIMLVLFGTWTARSHLKDVFRTACGRAPEIDESAEILSYRASVLTLLGSLCFMGYWLTQSGLPAWITPIYLFFALLLFIGITRVVAEGGLVFIFAPMIASDFVVAGFGTRALGATGIMAFAFTYTWASDILTFVMASAANGLKLAEETVRRGRHLIFWGMLLAIVTALAGSVWTMLDLGYRFGGINTDQFFFDLAAKTPFQDAAIRMQSVEGPHWINWAYTAGGAGLMGLLMLARPRFTWWPIHPLGLPTSAVFGFMFFSVFLAWLIKTVVLKYGGPELYMRTRPFFLGLILGQFMTAGIWYAIDYVLGGSYNVVMLF